MFLKHLNNDIDYQTNTGEERFYILKLQKATADLFRAFLKKSWPFTDIKQKKRKLWIARTDYALNEQGFKNKRVPSSHILMYV